MDDNADDDVVIGLARKAKPGRDGGGDDEGAEEKDMSSGKYDKILDSAADGIMQAISDDDKDALKEELMDFVRACMKQDAKG